MLEFVSAQRKTLKRRTGREILGELVEWLEVPQRAAANDRKYVERLAEFVKEWEPKSETRGLAEFLEYLDYYEQAGGTLSLEDDEPGDGVRLMTVHAAKGLEFPHVFIVRVNNRAFPATERPRNSSRLRSWSARSSISRRVCIVTPCCVIRVVASGANPPAGSRLLDLAEVRQMVRPFDPAALSYPWRHDDPALDRLCSEIQSLIQREEWRKASRREIFAGIWSLAHDRPVPVDFHLAARATIPYLDEPWYC